MNKIELIDTYESDLLETAFIEKWEDIIDGNPEKSMEEIIKEYIEE